jgi:DNA end-binding protein Ku
MQTLLYGDEVRSFSEVPIGDATLREGELNLAKQLVDQIASETFDPNDYHDDVRERIQADIERKVQGQEIAAPAPTQEPARVIDLMEALKASLGAKAKATAAEAATSSDEAPDAGGIATRRPARRATGAAPAAKAEPRKRAAKR